MYDNSFLYDRLIKLGDLIGDGCHLEPDGKWITKEYKETAMLLGLLPKRKRNRNTSSINEFMDKQVQNVKCECGGNLIQTRKGSFIAKCSLCNKKYRLGKIK